jgi:5-(carboxyamino)imidazole ribonucleotide mutase
LWNVKRLEEKSLEKKVVILMGSRKDLEFCKKIASFLDVLDVKHEFRVASAHKTPLELLEILKEYEGSNVVYITVAGRSNALSAFADAHTIKPVIACPPYSEKFAGADLYSSLRVPSGIGSVVTIEPEGAAIAAAKILALTDGNLAKRVREYQSKKREEVRSADEMLRVR